MFLSVHGILSILICMMRIMASGGKIKYAS